MLKNKVKIFVGIFILVIIGVLSMGILNSLKKSPISVVENKMHINLTDMVEVVEGKRNKKNGEEHVKLKLLIKEEKVNDVRDKISSFFSPNLFEGMTKAEMEKITPDFGNNDLWLDLEKKDIIYYYQRMISGNLAKTLEIWAFISKNKEDNKYYLYIFY